MNEKMERLRSMKIERESKREREGRKEVLDKTAMNIGDIQSQIEEYKKSKKFIVMKENQFQFIYDTLMNKIQMFEETLN